GRRAGERRITHANVPKSVPKGHENDPRSVSGGHFDLWRGQDSNLRPLGYEPSELPSCSTPRRDYYSTRSSRAPDAESPRGKAKQQSRRRAAMPKASTEAEQAKPKA